MRLNTTSKTFIVLLIPIAFIACAKPPPPLPPIPANSYQYSTAVDNLSPELRLEKLAQLKAKGLISTNEYQRLKAEILASL